MNLYDHSELDDAMAAIKEEIAKDLFESVSSLNNPSDFFNDSLTPSD